MGEQELKKLRHYCQSPHSAPWKTAEQLKNPKRFASFVNGSPHVSEIELSAFERDLNSMGSADSKEIDEDDHGDEASNDELTIEKLDHPKENDLSTTPAEILEKDSYPYYYYSQAE